MIYVIRTLTRHEDETIDLINKKVSKDIAIDSFSPKRKRLKKYEGSWKNVIERCFPGYVFIESNDPIKLYRELFKVPTITKLIGLGKDNDAFIPLSKEEEKYLYSLANKQNNYISELSNVEVLEGKKVQIIDGPLIGLEGKVIKIDLHKRIARVLVSFGNTPCEVNLGINIINKKDD